MKGALSFSRAATNANCVRGYETVIKSSRKIHENFELNSNISRFTLSTAMLTGADQHGDLALLAENRSRVALNRARQATRNACIESFNGRLRDELLNETLFLSLARSRTAPDQIRTLELAGSSGYSSYGHVARSTLQNETPLPVSGAPRFWRGWYSRGVPFS
jgi:hypothetical protein